MLTMIQAKFVLAGTLSVMAFSLQDTDKKIAETSALTERVKIDGEAIKDLKTGRRCSTQGL